MNLDYELPESCIAARPAVRRDGSRLLAFGQSTPNGLSDYNFVDLPKLLPQGSVLWTNQTRVLRARLRGCKPTGGAVEFLLLDPNGLSVEQAMAATQSCTWIVLIGGAKRWKHGDVSIGSDEPSLCEMNIRARRLPKFEGRFCVHFSWKGGASFSEVLDRAGSIPLPPYMNRDSDERDADRYQTLFAQKLGSVAAPTAGLHFSQEVLAALKARDVASAHVTLHVGVGTFKPVSGPLAEHVMHAERCEISRGALQVLAEQPDRTVVGTTTLRTLESVYWLACLLRIATADSAQDAVPHALVAQAAAAKEALASGASAHIPQWIDRSDLPEYGTYEQAVESLLDVLESTGQDALKFSTEIMIVPGYRIRSTHRLVTNFHMPGSTLLCIIEAAVGPIWRKAYAHAVKAGYRFLSYGDACLLSFQPSKT